MEKKSKNHLDRNSTLKDLEDLDVVKSYDSGESDEYKRFNRHPWEYRVGCRSISDFYCEGCNVVATVERQTMKLSNIKCPRCDNEDSDKYSMYFVKTKAIDVRYQKNEEDD